MAHVNKILKEKKLRSDLMDNNEITFNLEEDLNQIAVLIRNYMDEKYIGALRHKLDGYRSECEHDLCKEAQLVQALIPFLPNESKYLKLLTDAMVYNDMVEKCFSESEELTSLYRDSNSEKEKLKKLVYKLIIFKLITIVEQQK